MHNGSPQSPSQAPSPGALLPNPSGRAEPPALLLLLQGREAILIKGACNILRAGICCSLFKQKALHRLQQLWDCVSTKWFLFPAINIFLSFLANLLPLHPYSFFS